MSNDQILGTLLSIWMGFAIALQLHITIAKNKALMELSGQPEKSRLVFIQLIYSVTGLVGAFGFAWLIGHVPQFQGFVFPGGLFSGIALFLLTLFLSSRP
jgi:tetrahydromethanopterin S-methyltransferase subunit E